ncbi:MAG: NYN domain-containing protein [Proteobacteria bacterium]|nr:NYN domain-containing protein [Pseudomonadota bacterium]
MGRLIGNLGIGVSNLNNEPRINERAAFVIDGSNFYYSLQGSGISKGHLNFKRLAEHLAMDRAIVSLEFFICSVQPADSPEAQKQRRFFSELHKSGVKIREGTLVQRQRRCPACGAVENFRQEKGVDVLLAITMAKLATENRTDVIYLLSCDADFVPVVNYVRGLGKKVFLVAPKGSKYGTLGKACNAAIPVDQMTVNECQAY